METRWINEIKANLARKGIDAVSYTQGSKHSRITITNGRATCLLFTALTPSDNRAMMNIVKTAKHALARKEGLRP